MSTMQAWRLHAYGGPETIHRDTIPIPSPGNGEVLVRISKAGLNPFDWKIREGYVRDHMPLPLPYTLGVDFVGTVSTLAPGTSGKFRPGDRVMSFTEQLGAFAEHKIVDESVLARVPEDLSDEQAMTLPIPALTAWQALTAAGDLRPGTKILIQGASGLVGAFAIQFAKNAGCYVYATASGKNRDFVVSLGADRFFDYQTERFDEVVGAGEVDLVLDCILLGGTDNTTDRSWKVLNEGGAIVSVADAAVLGKVPEGKRGFFPRILPDARMLEEIAGLVVEGKIQTKLAQVFKSAQLVEGMEMNKRGGLTGRTMVDFSSG